MLLQKLNNRFNETNSKLLYFTTCFSHLDSFHTFDLHRLVKLVMFYPHDFSNGALVELVHQLKIYIADMRDDDHFGN